VIHELARTSVPRFGQRPALALRHSYSAPELAAERRVDAHRARMNFRPFGAAGAGNWRPRRPPQLPQRCAPRGRTLPRAPVARHGTSRRRTRPRKRGGARVPHCKRATISLRETLRRSGLFDIEYRRRETFAFACEVKSTNASSHIPERGPTL
jgi:hypothetical protein